MKKVLYIILLIAEAAIGLLALGALTNWITGVGSIILGAATAAIAIVLAIRAARQKKQGDLQARKKTLTWIALVFLAPTVLSIVIGVLIIIALSTYFG